MTGIADIRALEIPDNRDESLVDLDGTGDRSGLGGNVVTGVSLACLKTGAVATGVSLYRHVGGATAATLPVSFLDVIEGGEGGPNQEFGLAFALETAGLPGVTALALGTDGPTGTNVAGLWLLVVEG